ncbi:HAD-IIIC family phosphatase [Roseovarius tolerans]|nr:HAD-IIIC family phosphatase [Roseovarius tolerans]
MSTIVDQAFARAEFQKVVFAQAPRRADLLRAAKKVPTKAPPIRLRVHRNHPFEFIASLLPAMCAYDGRSIDVEIGEYDDSLSLALQGRADVELIWLDYERYKLTPDALSEWLKCRVEALRGASPAPILVADWPRRMGGAQGFNESLRAWGKDVPGVRILPLDEAADALGDEYLDKRMASVGATRLSERANVTLARLMGLCWLPAVLRPRLKAVVFDLDNTLWGGVLGEDGQDGVIVDQGYDALQDKAVELAQSGLFLGILSRNEPEDVEAMFASERMTLPSQSVSARTISWGSKSEGMAEIAKTLRVGFDAILFVDDNPGELAAVASTCPGIQLLHATPDPLETCRALEFYPGLFTFGGDATDALRFADLATNDARQSLRAQAESHKDYLASLDLELRVAVNPAANRARLHQLSQKTNQFNLSLQRLSETDIADVLSASDRHVVAIWLADKFSESGLIAAMFVSADGQGMLHVDELCVSCRALGRGVEDIMMVTAIDAAAAAVIVNGGARIEQVRFQSEKGPRNYPARAWLEAFSGQTLGADGSVTVAWTETPRTAQARALPVRIKTGEPNANQ